MIRKHVWLSLIDSVPDLTKFLKQNVKIEYIRNIYIKVIMEKRRYYKNLEKSHLNNKIISVMDLENNK